MKPKKPSKRSLLGSLSHDVHERLIDDFNKVLEEVDPLNTDFRVQHLKNELLTKLCTTDGNSADERRSLAIKKWLGMEERNRKTNIRLLVDEADFGFATSEQILTFAAKVVADVIGSEVPEDIFSSSMFTNGASTRVKRGPTAIAQKFMGKADATPSAWELFQPELLQSDIWAASFGDEPNFVQGSVLFTVPKNSDIDRVAAKEPELNMYLQRGVGNHFRACLKKKGINLDDQTRNQRLAKLGSKEGFLATLDLSSASDLVSSQLVCRLLPTSWFVLLDSVRVQRTLIDGEWHELHMFSSMGNGFTFELESLLFFAISCSLCYHLGVRGTISVYGDDIIVPSKAAPAFSRVFHFLGFLLNQKKSFWRGGFRESCGKHWFTGIDVTPFYVREPIHHQARLIHFLNRFRAWCSYPAEDMVDPSFSDFFVRWAKVVDKRFYGGLDVDRIDALVTGHKPRMLLVRSRLAVRPPELGAYLHWLRGRELTEDPFVTTELSRDLGFVIRRNDSWRWERRPILHSIWR